MFLAFWKRQDLRLERLDRDHNYMEEGLKLEHTIWGTIDQLKALVIIKLSRFLCFLSFLCL